jgi:hypothetical protein
MGGIPREGRSQLEKKGKRKKLFRNELKEQKGF